jgi:hypothetical protein
MMVRWFDVPPALIFKIRSGLRGFFPAGNIVEKPGENRKQGYFQ